MNAEVLTDFLMWCTILNGGLLIFSFLMLAFAGGWVYRMHSRWFPMSRDTFTVVVYGFLGVYKILFLVFNVVPLVALLIVGA